MWDWDHDSETELDIQYKTQSQPTPAASNTDDSENAPLLSHKRVPGKIIPDRLEITFGDKTSTIIYNKKNIARKTLARKVPEPRGTLKPQWNILPDGTITKYSPHTITLDTDNRKNTVIRKNDLAIVTETKPREPEPEPKPRLIHMVACKTVGEYKRNQEKIRKFCLEEKAALAKQQEAQARSSRSTPLQPTPMLHNQPGPSKSIINTQPLGHSELIAMAKKNQQAQKRKRTTKRTLNKQEKPARSQQRTDKSPGNPKRPQWLKNAKARLTKQTNSSIFDQKSKAAALQQTKESKLQAERKLLYSSSSDSKSFTSINKAKLKFSPTVKIHSIEPESPGTPPFEIVTSSDPNDFMIDNKEPTQDTSGSSSPLVTKRPQGIMKSTPRIDKIVNKIWSQPSHERITIDNSSADDFPIQPPIRKIEVVYLDTTTSENTTNADVPVANLAEETTAQHSDIPVVELSEDTPPIENNEPPRDEPIENTEPPRNVTPRDPEQHPPTHEEEHKTPTTSPGKSSISSIHMSDFFNQDEF